MITNEELTKAILELREAQTQTDKQMKETGEYIKTLSQKTNEQMKRTDKQIQVLSQNISEL